MSDSLVSRNHAEAVALFRAQVIGAVARSQLDYSELAAELRELAGRKYRPPGRRTTKQYGVSTPRALDLRLPARWPRGAPPRSALRPGS